MKSLLAWILASLPHELTSFVLGPIGIHNNNNNYYNHQRHGIGGTLPLPSLRSSAPSFRVSLIDDGGSKEKDGEAVFSPVEFRNMLEEGRVSAAEECLMGAIAELNGAVHNHPELFRCLVELFRTKILLAEENDSESISDKEKYGTALDRMGLASLLIDLSQYQQAADELHLTVQSLSKLVNNNNNNQPSSYRNTLNSASSLLFRTRAMVCDWNDYDASSTNLASSTLSALKNGAVPSVHPFEALHWPSLSLRNATAVANAYGNRALAEAEPDHDRRTAKTANLLWTDLDQRIPRNNVPFVRVVRNPLPITNQASSVIRVGYLSPDFTGKHPLAFLMQDVFRLHDPSRFQIILYSLGGRPDGSFEVNKIIHGRPTGGTDDDSGDVDGSDGTDSRPWRTLQGSIRSMAQTIYDDELDVVVDLCGYTGTSLVAAVMACLSGLETPLLPTQQQPQPQPQPPPNDDQMGKPIHPLSDVPPPIRVAYMGFPASSGTPYIDYMIADEVVVPKKTRPLYTENILFMPHCYFVNSHRYIWNDDNVHYNNNSEGGSNINNNNSNYRNPPRREDYNLPPKPAFVFCCHSRPDKIDPSTFTTWIKALKRTRDEGRTMGIPGMANAVLWLLKSKSGPRMETNLQMEASNILYGHGTENGGGSTISSSPAPLIFCDTAPRNEHLERLALADLFLDTPAYNAHTVGCDSLAAGVPMISLLRPWTDNGDGDENDGGGDNGNTRVQTEKLASRVGASLLKSASKSSPSFLSDALVVGSMNEYEDRMVELARSCCTSGSNTSTTDCNTTVPSFVALKEHLCDQRSEAPLWDTERWVRNLEVGLATMVDLRTKGADETDIYVVDPSEEDK